MVAVVTVAREVERLVVVILSKEGSGGNTDDRSAKGRGL